VAITVDTLNPFYSSLDGVLFDKNQTTLIQYLGGRAGSYTIPTGVTNIGTSAFNSCTGLTNVTIGSSVASIGYDAFWGCTGLTSVTIPDSITSLGKYAFSLCTNLTSVYFRGNTPDSVDCCIFEYGTESGCITDPATVYYLPGTTGWEPTFSHLPTAVWQPQVETSDASFGVRTNQFGFNINWASGMTVVVEACTNLANPTWSPISTNTLPDGSSYFSDPQWTNYPVRFYRLRWP
jgi:hypothetical protein